MEMCCEALRLPEKPLEGIKLVVCDMDGTAPERQQGVQRRDASRFCRAAQARYSVYHSFRADADDARRILRRSGDKLRTAYRFGRERSFSEWTAARLYMNCRCPGNTPSDSARPAITWARTTPFTPQSPATCAEIRTGCGALSCITASPPARGERPVPTSAYEDTTPGYIASEHVYKIFIDNPDSALREKVERLLSAYPEVRTDCSEGSSISIVRREGLKGRGAEKSGASARAQTRGNLLFRRLEQRRRHALGVPKFRRHAQRRGRGEGRGSLCHTS